MTKREPDTAAGLSLRAGSTDAEAVRRYYDAWAGDYDVTLVDWDYRAPNDCADVLMPALAGDARVLDVGCGTGLMGAVLRGRSAALRIDGLDISAASLEQAAARGVYETLTAHDLQSLPLPVSRGAYDAAVCVGVLTYLPDTGAVLRDLCRCVRPGGAVAFTQRSDLWPARGMDGVLAAMAEEGLCTVTHVSAPRPYLPGNADFGDDIEVIHTLLTVA